LDASWRGGGCPSLGGIEEEEVVSLQSQASGRHPLALELEHDHPSFRVFLDAGDPQLQILNLHWRQSLFGAEEGNNGSDDVDPARQMALPFLVLGGPEQDKLGGDGETGLEV